MPPRSHERQLRRRTSIFINAPYGPAHQNLFLAYVVGAISLGLTPRAAIETYDSTTSRLERIAALLRVCRFSLHDLSVVGVDAHLGVSRFNMPLELGMAIQEQYRSTGPDCHRWIAFDAEPYRVDLSTSDLRGFEGLSHGGTPDGVLRGILGIFKQSGQSPFLRCATYLQAFKPHSRNCMKKPEHLTSFLRLCFTASSL